VAGLARGEKKGVKRRVLGSKWCIIGSNGAGKSTLLKILSRIVEPTAGRIQIDGRVASLLEVGTGFHPELTGRENIFLNGAILGMGRLEIKRKFDEIVAFSEVEKFLDTPVKRYSSGMYVRLAFAVAAHLEPEVLIIDEVLAVGDASFQRKCLGKMHDAARAGRTVLFVSHNMNAVGKLCSHGIVLQHGKLMLSAEPAMAVDYYYSLLAKSDESDRDRRTIASVGENEVRYVDWELISGNLGVPYACYARSHCCFRVTLVCRRRVRGLRVGFALRNAEGSVLLSAHSDDLNKDRLDLPQGTHFVDWKMRVPLQAGQYSLHVGVASQTNEGELKQDDIWKPTKKLEVIETQHSILPSEWQPLINEEISFHVSPNQ